MTTLDLQSAYYQIKVNNNDAYKTCFITPFGTFLFKRMPFGLRNAPATFQRLMDRFKASVSKVKILVYLDDLIICSPTFLEHIKDLDIVLSKLQEYRLRVNNGKSRFCCEEVKYLGYVLTPDGICVDQDKTVAISQRKEPKNVKELISFIQTCSWYRRFINSYAEISKPLTYKEECEMVMYYKAKRCI